MMNLKPRSDQEKEQVLSDYSPGGTALFLRHRRFYTLSFTLFLGLTLSLSACGKKVTPIEPVNPIEKPDKPDKPKKPDKPEDPGEGDPDEPDDPDDPEEPENPDDPENPEPADYMLCITNGTTTPSDFTDVYAGVVLAVERNVE